MKSDLFVIILIIKVINKFDFSNKSKSLNYKNNKLKLTLLLFF